MNETAKADQLLSEQMRVAARALTPAKRRENGRKAWQTRRANLARKLAAQGGNK